MRLTYFLQDTNIFQREVEYIIVCLCLGNYEIKDTIKIFEFLDTRDFEQVMEKLT